MRSVAKATLLCALASVVLPLQAQTHVTVAGGALSWDASGTGESFTLAVRGHRAFPIRWLVGEFGVAYAPLEEQFNPNTTHTLAIDGQVQLQAPWSRVQPYLGVGPSLFTYLTEAGGRNRVQPGFSAGVGVRVWPAARLGFVVDGRWRGWEFADATDITVNVGGEATLGLMYRF